MDGIVIIDGSSLSLEELAGVARKGTKARLSSRARAQVAQSRAYVEGIVNAGRTVYGITTGFGKFSDVLVSPEQTTQLQHNLIVSHACGVGPHLPMDAARAVMLLRANALAKGYSGIRLETVELLLDMLNCGVIPAIPEKGSLGASGDLAPLAHMVLPMIGLGEAYYQGELLSGAEAMSRAGLAPVELSAKEGLALINGTQVLTAVGALAAYDAWNLAKIFDISAALTGEALNAITDAYLEELHQVRPHPFQLAAASNMRRLLEGSGRTTRQGEVRVQDAYSLRCVPQVHGASKDAIRYVLDKIAIEMNSATDNPIIIAELDMALSGGNFHGQPMALAFDFLGIAAAELANISERRIERLVNPQLSGLPAFLTEDGGLCSGFMIAQYAAASLVSENKVLAHPASVDSIPSSANQEDHVSMGTIAARKARDIVENAKHVAAIELLAAAQAVELHTQGRGKPLGKGTQAAYSAIRSRIAHLGQDRVFYPDINLAAQMVGSGEILNAVEAATGLLD